MTMTTTLRCETSGTTATMTGDDFNACARAFIRQHAEATIIRDVDRFGRTRTSHNVSIKRVETNGSLSEWTAVFCRFRNRSRWDRLV